MKHSGLEGDDSIHDRKFQDSFFAESLNAYSKVSNKRTVSDNRTR